jgi:hypothetical protein
MQFIHHFDLLLTESNDVLSKGSAQHPPPPLFQYKELRIENMKNNIEIKKNKFVNAYIPNALLQYDDDEQQLT